VSSLAPAARHDAEVGEALTSICVSTVWLTTVPSSLHLRRFFRGWHGFFIYNYIHAIYEGFGHYFVRAFLEDGIDFLEYIYAIDVMKVWGICEEF